PMVITNNERKIVYVNSSFEELTGYRLEEILHKNTKFLHSGIHDKEFYTEMDNAINEYGRWQGEIWDRKKSGEIFPKHLTITAVERQDGKRINYVGIYQDPIEMKKIEENFVRLEKYDLLTGLPNDKYLREILTKEMSIKSTSHEEQFVISFKITNFNEIVASYGYRLMDEVMVNMINRVELIFSGIGTLFRTEKEVFMVYGTIDTQIQSLESIAEELNSAISIGFSCDDEIVFINIIIGILPIINTYDNVYRILEDVNLTIDWAAKSNNGNYAFYDESIREQLQNDVKIETLLRTAIDNMELSLLYQPQHDTKTGKIIGLEALVRWNNDEIGQVSPFIFIPIAERLGLIDQIGRWVMLEACKQNKKWQKLGLPKIPVSVNLSPIQFKNRRLVDDIKSILQECGLEGKYLGVEITENALVEDIKDINKKLSSLKDMGIKISIDDFGTGYS
ncbi:MAG: EAL domain-containing protein, partial [Gottschalkiaceae bacterium]